MKFIISPEIFGKFPELYVGVVIAKGIDNKGMEEKILKSIRDIENEIRTEFDAQTLSQQPKIDVWRKTYSAFGAKPKEYQSSVENLYRLVLKGVSIRHINKLVDIYNYISLKHMVPVGGEDINKVQGDIKLTIAGPNEPTVLLLGDKEPRPPHEGEVIYKDNISAICRRFNWREADRTKFTEETKNAILVTEALPPVTKDSVNSVVNELADLVKRFCNAETKVFVLNSNNTSIEF